MDEKKKAKEPLAQVPCAACCTTGSHLVDTHEIRLQPFRKVGGGALGAVPRVVLVSRSIKASLLVEQCLSALRSQLSSWAERRSMFSRSWRGGGFVV
jgi:hypothetical protein